ncbi:MAG: JAB domain-containing protein [Chitinophagaceae bacterium]
MESELKQLSGQKVSEVELVYKSNVKASQRPRITCSKDSADLLRTLWNENNIELLEQFKILLMNRGNKVLGYVELSSGGVTGTVADPKLIFMAALKSNACAIIISHNHPSGNLKPSAADEQLTQKIKSAGQLLDISLLDHIIMTTEGYYSFADEGLL